MATSQAIFREAQNAGASADLQLMTGDGDERIVPGRFWRGRQVWARDIDRIISKAVGNLTLIPGSECHELVGAEGTYGDHSRGQRNVIGTSYGQTTSDIRAWSINQNGGDATDIVLFTSDALSASRRYQIVIYFTKP